MNDGGCFNFNPYGLAGLEINKEQVWGESQSAAHHGYPKR